jgi:hypothetical protein
MLVQVMIDKSTNPNIEEYINTLHHFRGVFLLDR